VRYGCGARRRGAVDDGGIGGPPAYVAGSLIEVAVDQFDGIEREVDHALAARPLGHPLDRAHQVAGPLGQLGFELTRDRLDLLADAAHFLRHHGKARTLRAGTGTFDQRVQRQHFHLVGDVLDRFGLLAGDPVDLGGQPRNQRGDIRFVLGNRWIGRFACHRSPSTEIAIKRGRHRLISSALRLSTCRAANAIKSAYRASHLCLFLRRFGLTRL
jgi:hypothetical protein